MTKIAISPNVSGTGTFTLSAPNSNTDRTFSLPDATGEVLTDAENNPAKLFRRDNILGTVSQSGGVPTGAIIERGSNANGEFVKFADGTLICKAMPSGDVGVVSVNMPAGWFRGAHIGSWPVAFVGIPTASVSASGRSGGNGFLGCEEATSVSFRASLISADSSYISSGISAVGIGSWY